MRYEFTGTVVRIFERVSFPSGFSKRTILVADDPNRERPNNAVFDFFKADEAKLNGLREGDRVKVGFYVNANQSKADPNRWYVSLKGADVSYADGAPSPRAVPNGTAPAGVQNAVDPKATDTAEQEDLPF